MVAAILSGPCPVRPAPAREPVCCAFQNLLYRSVTIETMPIRVVTPADLEAVIALWHRVFPEYNDPRYPQRDPRTNILRKLAFGDGLFWLGHHGHRVVGTVMAGYDGHRGWIYSLGVDPDHRRGGLGRALVAHAETELRTRGCPKINLQVLDTNTGALNFWRSLGYGADEVISLGKRL